MSEITTSQKARAFAMYIGQPYKSTFRHMESGTMQGVTYQPNLDMGLLDLCFVHEGQDEMMPTNDLDDVKLLLRPLSAITDSDAKDWLLPFGHEALKVYRDETSVSVDYRWKATNPALANDDGYCYSGDTFYFNGDLASDAFQFLIERGYSVPLRCLNNQDPITAGIAVTI